MPILVTTMKMVLGLFFLMNLWSGKKSVKHHSKNCCEEHTDLVKKMQEVGGYTRGVFTHERLLIVLFPFIKGSFLVTCDGH